MTAPLAAPIAGAQPTVAPTPQPTAALVMVPAVAAIPVDQAIQQLQSAGLAIDRKDDVTLDSAAGLVVTQDPPAGASVGPGSTIHLLVSKGIAVPELRGQAWDDVKPWLDEHGWPLGQVRFVVANVGDWGKVLTQNPAPESGLVPSKQAAPMTLQIAGPPGATRTGYPRAEAPPAQAAPVVQAAAPAPVRAADAPAPPPPAAHEPPGQMRHEERHDQGPPAKPNKKDH
jgi:beta-lactam-binding protein with PASTA domain